MLISLAAIFIIPNGIAPNIIGPNYKNVTVWTHVNITHSKPEVVNITIYESANASARNITVNAGGLRNIYCNATLRSWDGFSDITYVNATLFYNGVGVNSSSHDDNNTHYTNSSCTLNESVSAYLGWYVCSFDVYYYANNGTWSCNVTVENSWNYTNTGVNSTLFYPVYSLNVTDGIDYGGVAVYGFSNDTQANVTNFGNMPINITVEGYGTKRNDGLAMNCSLNSNITVDNEKFSLSNGTAYGSKTALTGNSDLISGLTMPKQTLSSTQIINSTYWQLYIPPNPAGNCTGWILFTAMAP